MLLPLCLFLNGRKEKRKLEGRNKRNVESCYWGGGRCGIDKPYTCARTCVWKRSTAICGRVSTHHPPFLRCLIDRFNYAGAACTKRKSKVRIARGMMVHSGCFVQLFSTMIQQQVQLPFVKSFQPTFRFVSLPRDLVTSSCIILLSSFFFLEEKDHLSLSFSLCKIICK